MLKAFWRTKNRALCALLAVGLLIPAMPVAVIADEHIDVGVSGYVTDASVETTAPVAGAEVTVWSIDTTPAVMATATTDADGYYVAGVVDGDYWVSFAADGYYPQFFEGVDQLSDATTVTVEATITAGIDAALVPIPADVSGISGSVFASPTVDATVVVGVPDALVTVWNAEATLTVEATVTTDDVGAYMVEVEPGDYIVQFAADGFYGQFYNGAADLSDATTVTVVAEMVTEGIDAFLVAMDVECPVFVELWGEDRYETALAISQYGWEDDSSDVVVLARGDRFPDALTGGSLAGLRDAPILLTRPTSLHADVADEIVRLGASTVYLLGEELALSADVETAVEAIDGVTTVTRVGGETRYDTANMIAEYVIAEIGEDFGGEAFVATGARFPDSLAASPIAGAQGMPIYLAHPASGVSSETVAAMDGVEAAFVLGQTLAVSVDTQAQLEGVLGEDNVERIGGEDRYETAALVAEFGVDEYDHTWDMVGIATGVRFPDSLTGGALQARSGSVVLLTRATSLTDYTADLLEEHAASICELRVFGGPLAIDADVRAAIWAIFGAEYDG